MDRRIKKTLARIYRGFGASLKEKDYSDISIEDILKKADVARSTFYAHFKTKDEVLDSLLDNIFHHVFSHSLAQEETHDFSHESILDHKHLYTHILYHLRDEQELILTILSASCRNRFLEELKRLVRPLVEQTIHSGIFPGKDVPAELAVEGAANLFVTLVEYFFRDGCAMQPELATDYFFAMNQ